MKLETHIKMAASAAGRVIGKGGKTVSKPNPSGIHSHLSWLRLENVSSAASCGQNVFRFLIDVSRSMSCRT